MSNNRSFLRGAILGAAFALAIPLAIDALAMRNAQASPADVTAAASFAFKLHEKELSLGMGRAEEVYRWSKRWFDADKAQNSAAAKDHLARMVALQTKVKANVATGAASMSEAADAAYYVAEANALAP